ncbi:MAG: bifunctional DNA-binding transcriptional regulator/O6-methylguanine-DNA methyltransferase Ada [Acidobacteria bacterium]|nr:MAG: bifunctional DNA-binding transcriptional regulator/O6-methylguanine-DNA methyltransferase Ada [Acidobacteriota bacterium]
MTTISTSGTKGKRPQSNSDKARWQAVVDKDRRADGLFWYSVKTTGTYCRPSCPSRLPKRENVAFHVSSEDAESAGFRACKRCDPKGPGLASQHTKAVAKACRLIREAEEFPSLNQLSRSVKMSSGYFHRLFKATTGLTPKDYANAHRADGMKKALSKRETVTEAIYEAGYNSNGRFYAGSSKILGMKPKEYREGGTGNTIRFAIAQSSLGAILVASSQNGVCAILMGDDPEKLVRDLQDQFPKAYFIGGDEEYEKLVAKVIGLIEAPKIGFDLPLDIRGTAFQQRVWKELQRIPPGKTVSYSEVAKRIGFPRSVRAVAQACIANPLAVAVPCHRVVRKNGDLSGYRWGVDRKQVLLVRERMVT